MFFRPVSQLKVISFNRLNRGFSGLFDSLSNRFWTGLLTVFLSFICLACTPGQGIAAPSASPVGDSPLATNAPSNSRQAIFAGGCFWCMEQPFDQLPGVLQTTSGYTGGTVASPSYRQVSGGGTGHAEAVQITYNPDLVKYEQLLDTYWHNIDPFDAKGQFCDKGNQYRSAIFYTDGAQKQLAEHSKAAQAKAFNQTIATEITAAGPFYPAEDYHQNYYQTNAVKYQFYRYGCGRDRRLQAVWGSAAPH